MKDGTRNSNEHVIELVTKYSAAFAGVLASLNVGSQPVAELIEEAETLLKNPAVKGFKFHPPDQNFYPNDRKHYELWKLLEDGNKPVMFPPDLRFWEPIRTAAKESAWIAGGRSISIRWRETFRD